MNVLSATLIKSTEITPTQLIVMSADKTNSVYVVMKADYQLSSGEVITKYLCTYFKDVVLRKEAQGNYQISHGNSMHMGSTVNVVGYSFVTGYATEDGVISAARSNQTNDANYSSTQIN
ncbi:MAG: hypothetical protein MR283_04485 [Erysipelotrichaceae bacterium]|nr:hypothetical protein [Erysipelotrichaceae bacterium]MDY6035690.1 hypothetical protein [Bulleidia sp.]